MNRIKSVLTLYFVLPVLIAGCSGGEDAAVKYNDGVAAFSEKRFDDAVKHFNFVIDLDDDFLNAYLMLSKIYYYNRDYKRSLEILDKLIDKDPDHTGALYWRARTLVMSGPGAEDDSVNLLNRVLEVDSSHIPARLLLSLLHEKKGNYREALHQYLAVLSEEENLVSARGNLAILYMRLGMTGKASAEIEKAARIAEITGHGIENIKIIKSEFDKWGE